MVVAVGALALLDLLILEAIAALPTRSGNRAESIVVAFRIDELDIVIEAVATAHLALLVASSIPRHVSLTQAQYDFECFIAHRASAPKHSSYSKVPDCNGEADTIVGVVEEGLEANVKDVATMQVKTTRRRDRNILRHVNNVNRDLKGGNKYD